MNVRLYVLQRATAALMMPLIIVHLILIIYATNNGLNAAAILERTRGSIGWALYYGVFVLAASVHAAIGVRTVAAEWLSLAKPAQNRLMWGFGLLLLVLGLRAVAAVIMPGTA
jgi:fumarate reductase subunit C